MKKQLLFIVITLFILTGLLYLQFGREPVVNHSMILENSDTYDLSLTITLNRLIILNRKNVEDSLIQKIFNNNFENMYFSYDVHGMPRKICVTVYVNALTYMLNLSAFEFQYIAD